MAPYLKNNVTYFLTLVLFFTSILKAGIVLVIDVPANMQKTIHYAQETVKTAIGKVNQAAQNAHYIFDHSPYASHITLRYLKNDTLSASGMLEVEPALSSILSSVASTHTPFGLTDELKKATYDVWQGKFEVTCNGKKKKNYLSIVVILAPSVKLTALADALNDRIRTLPSCIERTFPFRAHITLGRICEENDQDVTVLMQTVKEALQEKAEALAGTIRKQFKVTHFKLVGHDENSVTFPLNATVGYKQIQTIAPRTWSQISGYPITSVHELAFCQSTNHIALGLGKKVVVCNSTTGNYLYEGTISSQSYGAIHKMLFSPTEASLAVATSASLEVWDVSNKQQIRLFKHCIGWQRPDKDSDIPPFYGHYPPYYGSSIPLLWLSPDQLVFCSFKDATPKMHIFNVKTKALFTVPYKLPFKPATLAVSPDERYIAMRGDYGEPIIYTGNLKNGQLQHHRSLRNNNEKIFFTSPLAFSPDSCTIACGGNDGCTYIFDIKTGKCIKTLKVPSYDITYQAPYITMVSYLSHNLILMSTHKMVYIYDLTRVEPLFQLKGRCTEVSAQGHRLAVAHKDSTVSIWTHSGT